MKPLAQVLFVHGFSEHVERYDFSEFASKGIQVTAFDQRGFGRTAARTNTEGENETKKGLEEVLRLLEISDSKKSTIEILAKP